MACHIVRHALDLVPEKGCQSQAVRLGLPIHAIQGVMPNVGTVGLEFSLRKE